MSRIKFKYLDLEQALAYKEQLWKVCQATYTIEKEHFFARLPIFERFGLYFDKDKLVGFTFFFLDEIELEKKNARMLGLAFAAVLPEYTSSSIGSRGAFRFVMKTMLRDPLKPVYVWGLSVGHHSFRSIYYGSKVCYFGQDDRIPWSLNKALDLVGHQYFPETYSGKDKTAQIGFSLRRHRASLSEHEIQDEATSIFLDLVPSAKFPGNRKGVMMLMPTRPNLGFWLKKHVLGIGRKTKRRGLEERVELTDLQLR